MSTSPTYSSPSSVELDTTPRNLPYMDLDLRVEQLFNQAVRSHRIRMYQECGRHKDLAHDISTINTKLGQLAARIVSVEMRGNNRFNEQVRLVNYVNEQLPRPKHLPSELSALQMQFEQCGEALNDFQKRIIGIENSYNEVLMKMLKLVDRAEGAAEAAETAAGILAVNVNSFQTDADE